MRKLAAILATLALTASTGIAAPRGNTKARKASEERFVMHCIDDRTGPVKDGGMELADAERLCRDIVRHQHKIAKLAKLAARARAAGIDRLTKRAEWECAEEVSVACEDTTVRDHDDGQCSDATLEAKHAFDVCRGKAPVAE